MLDGGELKRQTIIAGETDADSQWKQTETSVRPTDDVQEKHYLTTSLKVGACVREMLSKAPNTILSSNNSDGTDMQSNW